ncbi:hypothetical protein SAMN06269301_3222 [Geobacter sp. DSM 9736]|nr:hypothetical protein SAMN06269301_3222 [Geobacter sp. DSM 9736]
MACWLLALALLGGCQTISAQKETCETTIRSYNRMVRWQEHESAERAVEEAARAEYRRRLGEKDLRIADYRIKTLTCDTERGEAEATVEYDYYVLPSTTLRTVQDIQKWRYLPNAKQAEWRIQTPPPEFGN